ncbi:MAG: type VI secretion system ATPase TssH, partial [Acidobacteria bacterium]|nr:type VI secretion system ATPase TssH [Acidobacteriota bacterium]
MAIRWEKLTVKSREALQRASEVATENGNPELLPLHLLVALLEDKEGIIVPVLRQIGAAPEKLLSSSNSELERLPKVSGGSTQPAMSSALQKAIDLAFKQAENFKDEYVSVEHLLLALTQLGRDPAQNLLKSAGATQDAILQALTQIRGSQKVTDENPEAKYQALERYAKDLTELARKGKLDPVI